jgi:hypothetical protein
MERNVDILNELNEISPLLAGIGKANVFAVPLGYFELVPDTLLACVNNEISAGEDLPAGYFDDLSNTILSKIEGTVANELQELSPFMAGIKKINPFEVPANYFEQPVVDMASQEEEENIPLILKDVNKLQPFEVPAGYFEQLAGNTLSNVREKSGAKIIAMPNRRNAILKYAAAAVFTGLVALGAYKYSGNEPVTIVNDTAKVESAAEIKPKMDDIKFEETLNNLSEDDIIKYLEKNGSENDIATLTSGIDENSLPSQEEYLTDEKALDNLHDIVIYVHGCNSYCTRCRT